MRKKKISEIQSDTAITIIIETSIAKEPASAVVASTSVSVAALKQYDW